MTNLTAPAPLRDRLLAVLDLVLDDSTFSAPIKKIVRKMVRDFLKTANEDDLRTQLVKMKDEIIPFLLDVDPNEDTHSDK